MGSFPLSVKSITSSHWLQRDLDQALWKWVYSKCRTRQLIWFIVSVSVRAVFHFLKAAVLLSSSRPADKSCRSVLIYTGAGGCVCWEWAQLAQGQRALQGQLSALENLPHTHCRKCRTTEEAAAGKITFYKTEKKKRKIIFLFIKKIKNKKIKKVPFAGHQQSSENSLKDCFTKKTQAPNQRYFISLGSYRFYIIKHWDCCFSGQLLSSKLC